MVLNGELAPGTQILEQELAEMVGMSRTPVREALIRLQSDGLVEVVPRHGVRIVPMSLTDMHDIYMILVGLEPVAASLAAERGVSEEELAVLIRATEAMESALDRDDMEGWALADEEFHLAVMHQSGNSRLTAIVTNTWDQVHRARQLTIRLRHPNQPRRSVQEHFQLIEAIRNRDAVAAAEIFRDHRLRGVKEQLEVLKTLGLRYV
jgi:DNA-binding GntR family transcriptional regulator